MDRRPRHRTGSHNRAVPVIYRAGAEERRRGRPPFRTWVTPLGVKKDGTIVIVTAMW